MNINNHSIAGLCLKCGAEHSRWRDAAKTQAAWYCRDCHNAYMREWRPKHSELPPEQKARANARSYANVYQRRGKLEQQPCECCGADKAEKHHVDYTRPLDVRWLCRPCHMAEHNEYRALMPIESMTYEIR